MSRRRAKRARASESGRRPVRRNGAGDGYIDEHGFHPIRRSAAYDEYKLYRGTIKRIGTHGLRRNPNRASRKTRRNLLDWLGLRRAFSILTLGSTVATC